MGQRQTIKIKDGSGDRTCFTITPNYILNHSSSTDQSLYLQLKRLAGEESGSVCYPSFKYLRKQMKIGNAKLRKSFEYLILHKWIDDLGKQQIKTKGGLQWVNVYKINDIWKMNADFYHNHRKPKEVSTPDTLGKGGSTGTPFKGVPELSKGVPVIGAYKEPYNKEPSIGLDKPTAPISLRRKSKKFPKAWLNRVCEAYQELRGVEPQGNEWLPIQQTIKTMFLAGRQPDEIIRCMEWLGGGDEEWMENWTIRTVKMKLPFYLVRSKPKVVIRKDDRGIMQYERTNQRKAKDV